MTGVQTCALPICLYPRLRRARLLAEIAYGLPHPLMRRLTSSQRVVEALVNAIESGPPDESSGGTALHALIADARACKADPSGLPQPLAGRTVMLHFTKASTRTRLSV